MNIVRFLSKTTMAAGIICAALAFSISCSDDKDDNNSGGGTGKWCVYLSIDWGDGEQTMCGEIGAKLSTSKTTLTEEMCNNNYDDPSIKDEKPEGCEVITD